MNPRVQASGHYAESVVLGSLVHEASHDAVLSPLVIIRVIPVDLPHQWVRQDVELTRHELERHAGLRNHHSVILRRAELLEAPNLFACALELRGEVRVVGATGELVLLPQSQASSDPGHPEDQLAYEGVRVHVDLSNFE
eukprot:UN4005